jgi:hypothetical protein
MPIQNPGTRLHSIVNAGKLQLLRQTSCDVVVILLLAFFDSELS